MKGLFAIILSLAISGCSPRPRSVVDAIDRNGNPLVGFPIRMEFSEGMRASALPRALGEGLPEGLQVLDLRTDVTGKASFELVFNERQPSRFRSLFPGAKRIPNQVIKMTPREDLPMGSSLSLGIPNP